MELVYRMMEFSSKQVVLDRLERLVGRQELVTNCNLRILSL